MVVDGERIVADAREGTRAVFERASESWRGADSNLVERVEEELL